MEVMNLYLPLNLSCMNKTLTNILDYVLIFNPLPLFDHCCDS